MTVAPSQSAHPAGLPPTPSPRRGLPVAVALLLGAAVLALYAQTAGFAFVFDDESFIVKNAGLRLGPTREGLRWAFTAVEHANWHPLTWLSHLVDVSLFGIAPGPPHLVNAALHAACGVVLFAVLRRLTGVLWPSAFAAALFAFHPLRVESVAWVTERKDSLSTIFALLALGAWGRYAARPSTGRYLQVTGCLALGLLSKQMVVTLPFVLVLADFWPLGRLRAAPGGNGSMRSAARLVLEKLPLLALSAAAALIAVVAQRRFGAVMSFDLYPFTTRVANALVSSAAYLGDMAWPIGLAAYYPHPGASIPGLKIAGAIGIIALFTTIAVAEARRRPYLAFGWWWYLGTLVPVIGLVQIGAQSRADRYTYLPSIGIGVALAWLLSGSGARRGLNVLRFSAGLAAIAALAGATWIQAATWRDDRTLFTRALARTSGNWLMHNNLGTVFKAEGDLEGAAREYQEALRLRPGFDDARRNLVVALGELGRTEEAQIQIRHLARGSSGSSSLQDLVAAEQMRRSGKVREAEERYRAALRTDPSSIEALAGLKDLLTGEGRGREAVPFLVEMLRIRPDLAVAHMNLANALSDEGRFDEALGHYAEALRLAPPSAEVYANRGLTYAQMGRTAEASADYRRALRLDSGNALARRGLQASPPDASR